MANLVPTKIFLQPSPEAATLFAPFGCTHPPICWLHVCSTKFTATQRFSSGEMSICSRGWWWENTELKTKLSLFLDIVSCYTINHNKYSNSLLCTEADQKPTLYARNFSLVYMQHRSNFSKFIVLMCFVPDIGNHVLTTENQLICMNTVSRLQMYSHHNPIDDSAS